VCTFDEAGASDVYDEGLVASLGRIDHRQRVAVLLVHGYGYSYREVAEVLDVSVAAVTNHVHRGLGALRSQMKEQGRTMEEQG
jgi:DNA-directed RNA polymerase specialized sigma24 family protein